MPLDTDTSALCDLYELIVLIEQELAEPLNETLETDETLDTLNET